MMTIGMTDTLGSEHKFRKYFDWLARGGSDIKCLTLSYRLDNLTALDACDAVVLSGGHDVDPTLYGGPTDDPRIIDIDRRRDDFERNVVDRVIREKLPLLGICRGLQLVNVHLGGTLIPDLESAGFSNHRSDKDAERRHDIVLEPASDLCSIVGGISGNTNTSHHQAALGLGSGLKAVARSADGIIEALELIAPAEEQFFLLVQWHPERMTDPENPCSKNILASLMSSIHLTRK